MCIESLHDYEDYNTSSQMLLNKVIENTDIAAVAQTQQYFSLSNLKFMSKNWYKFAECCSGIIPKLIDEISKETEKSDISKMLEIISNLKDYLLQEQLPTKDIRNYRPTFLYCYSIEFSIF